MPQKRLLLEDGIQTRRAYLHCVQNFVQLLVVEAANHERKYTAAYPLNSGQIRKDFYASNIFEDDNGVSPFG
jgi:hypothetical protein